jgi:hypothetical protein
MRSLLGPGLALLALALAPALVACGDSEDCGDAPAASGAPQAPPFTLTVSVTSTGAAWVSTLGKCASPRFEVQDGADWRPVRTVYRFTCPDGATMCPGPIPTPVELLPVPASTPVELPVWNGSELFAVPGQCGESGGDRPSPAPLGRYRVTVPYCLDRAACEALPPIAAPSGELCPGTHVASAEIEILGRGDHLLTVALPQ